MLRIAFALTIIGLGLSIWSVIDTYKFNKINMLNKKAVALLGASIFKAKGEGIIKGDGISIIIKGTDDGKITLVIKDIKDEK